MRVLALDLGTATGWAIGQDGALVDAGTWKLATAKEVALAGKNRMNRRLDPRIPALYALLCWCSPDYIVFEDVQFSSTTMQTQLWASFRTVIWVYASEKGISVECLGVQKLKQFATGHGGATKEMMIAALARKYPEQFTLASDGRLHHIGTSDFLDDNAADAVHLLKWAMKTLKA